MSEDADKISSIRSAIDAKLHEDGVYSQIRELIARKAEASTSTGNGDAATASDGEPTESSLIREVLESELVQQLLTTIKRERDIKQSHSSTDQDDGDENTQVTSTPHEPALYLRLAGGRAFLDHLTEDDGEDTPDDGVAKITENQIGLVRQFFSVTVCFQGQRAQSQDVMCAVEPRFNEHFRFVIAKKKTRSGRTKTGGLYEIDVVAPWEALCLVDEPVHIVLVKVTKKVVGFQHSTGPEWQELRRELLATHQLDWRRVLASTVPLVHMPLQLVDAMKVPVGTLDVRMDLLNFARTPAIAKDVTSFLNKDALEKNTLSHAFYRHAKEWWHEYRGEMDALDANTRPTTSDIDPLHSPMASRSRHRTSTRLVKLFAEDDEGRFRMVCKFVTPLRAPMALRSPNEAARFVSLLPYESTLKVGGVADETWRSIATTLAVGKGDVQDHAVLLASLLLGCGLDAYVCIGLVSSSKRPQTSTKQQNGSQEGEIGHVWVMTRDPDLANDSRGVLFWESLTGDRCGIHEQSSANSRSAVRRGYLSIDCVFNATRFYANLQPRQWKISEYAFDLEDASAWKSLDPRRIADLPSPHASITLTPPDSTATIRIEQRWTTAVKQSIASQRRAQGLVTKWSDELGFYLQPALNSYELERLYHVPQLENDLFQQTIKRFVKEGFTFQAVPLMFKSPSWDNVMETLEETPIGAKILSIQGRAAQFGFAVRCFAYPENLFVVWLMLAVSYQS